MNTNAAILCNVCCADVDGIAFRTRCHHFYCPQCAKATFGSSSNCAICSTRLCDGEVCEMSLTHRLSILTRNVSSMTDFVTAQLQYTAFQASSHNIKLGSIMDAQASDLEMLSKRLVEQEYVCESRVTACEHQLRDTSRSLCELQDAYNEKVRKCQAWEKAYNNVRSQISGRNGPPMQLSAVDRDEENLPASRADITTFRNVTSHHLTRSFPAASAAAVGPGQIQITSPHFSGFQHQQQQKASSSLPAPPPLLQDALQRRDFLSRAQYAHQHAPAPAGQAQAPRNDAAQPQQQHRQLAHQHQQQPPPPQRGPAAGYPSMQAAVAVPSNTHGTSGGGSRRTFFDGT